MGHERRYEKEKELFRERGGVLRTGHAIDAGIHPRTLYAMRDAGIAERLGRGLYQLPDLPGLSDPDLVSVALQVPGRSSASYRRSPTTASLRRSLTALFS
jgi:hypothetical protein